MTSLPAARRGLSLRGALNRLPVLLYRLGLGRLLSRWLLLLAHTGRQSGRRYQTLLQLQLHDPAGKTYYVFSGHGEGADWLRNVAHTPLVHVTVGGRTVPALAMRLPNADAAVVLRRFARRHPRQAAALFKARGLDQGAANGDAAARLIPVVALREIAEQRPSRRH